MPKKDVPQPRVVQQANPIATIRSQPVATGPKVINQSDNV